MLLRRLFCASRPDNSKVLVAAANADSALRAAGAPTPPNGWSVTPVVPAKGADGIFAAPNGWTRSSIVLVDGLPNRLGDVLDRWSGVTTKPKPTHDA